LNSDYARQSPLLRPDRNRFDINLGERIFPCKRQIARFRKFEHPKHNLLFIPKATAFTENPIEGIFLHGGAALLRHSFKYSFFRVMLSLHGHFDQLPTVRAHPRYCRLGCRAHGLYIAITDFAPGKLFAPTPCPLHTP
jgi:hypothetical protein